MTVFPLYLATNVGISFAFYVPPLHSTTKYTQLLESPSSWNADDDWSQLSEVEKIDRRPEVGEDLARTYADSVYQPTYEQSDQDQHIYNIIGDINNEELTPIYDTEWDDDNSPISMEDEMDQEISMLVRCNQSPEELLIEEGRALPLLTDEERYEVSQLVSFKDGIWEPTKFFLNAVNAIFNEHATDGVMKASNVASWMSKSIEERVSPNEKRVLLTLSRFSKYGSGQLIKVDFERLYIQAIQSALDRNRTRNEPTVESIWRDIRNHNILSPVETEREINLLVMKKKHGDHSESAPSWNKSKGEVMDECEIVEQGQTYATKTFETPEDEYYNEKEEFTSHELVEMSMDGKTPLHLSGGDFIFIDEESCVGCRQCVNVCPSSFLMLDNNRARTFQQGDTVDVEAALESCPVNCMHRVSFDELKELETVREHGDGRSDHRHLGRSIQNIPVHVAKMESDANRKSSWFHYIKQKCFMSEACPQKGCYACPHYSNPGDNPHFKQKQLKSQHIRAETFIELGVANKFRKTIEL